MPSVNWYSVASSADGIKLVAVSSSALIYTSTNSGTSWTSNSISQAPTAYWNYVASSADGTKLAAGSESGAPGIYISTNSGASWFDSGASGAIWTSIASSADGDEFVAVAGGGDAYMWQATPTPKLNLTTASNNLDFSWLVPSTNFVLQENSDLTTTNWMTLTNTPTLNLSDLNDEVVLSPSSSSGFFRLMSQ